MMEHDVKLDDGSTPYRWNDALHRVDYWDCYNERWEKSNFHETTVTVPIYKLVLYVYTWCEPCQGVTDND